MKAGMNGSINLSVLDGWWGESYDGKNGWAIKPVSESLSEEVRTREETRTLYELLQDQVVPSYYDYGKMGFSASWVKMSKRSMSSIIPRFNSKRMVGEYLAKCYLPASRQHTLYTQDDSENASLVAQWKVRVQGAWAGVTLRRTDQAPLCIKYRDRLKFEVAVNLNGLTPQDVVVEVLIGYNARKEPLASARHYRFEATGASNEAGESLFVTELQPEQCGNLEYRIRVYPCHDLLTHPFELGMMRWL
jgi:starch phosphorylase